ncbi:hypothetical protein ACGFMM_34160 [Streptomyces sp. NPDC048604]|uniref:hypothetical protein n=1 Tax=Streptomyces sp. NPDC048604 TaxID=3365578 RepID=UPI0037213196
MDDIMLGDMPVRVVPGGPMPLSVDLRFGEQLVVAGPYRSADDHERHLLATSGAGSWVADACDELRFASGTGALVSAWFQVPGRVAQDRADLSAWLDVARVGVRLAVDPGSDFELPPVSVRWCERSGSALVCLTEEGFSEDASVRSRLTLAKDLDLLVADGRYVGWLLEHPAAHLSNSWTEVPDSPEDPELGAWVARFFTLTDDDVFDTIVDGEPAPLEPLGELLAEVHTETGDLTRRKIFRDVLDEVLDWHSGFDA